MKFMDLTYTLDNLMILNPMNFVVSGLYTDSRKVKPDSIFFALKGEKFNGENFIEAAIANGAKAIVVSESFNQKLPNISIIKTKNINNILTNCVRIFYKDNLPENIYAVTGTNGKTSVANFTAQILSKSGRPSASVGTLGTLISGNFDNCISDNGMTTPDIVTLFQDLQELKNKNIEDVVMEVSSHGLHQKRLGHLKFNSGAFTNFTQDHLDYHQTMEEYFSAKLELLSHYITEDGYAVINSDIPEYQKIIDYCTLYKRKVFEFGKKAKDLKIKNIDLQETGIQIKFEYQGRTRSVQTNLIGEFQAYNLACSIALLLTQNYDFEEILSRSEGLTSVKGRMELIPLLNGKAKAVVDYAHTPDALEKAIKSVRLHTSGKVILVFGCGGDRDKTKRLLMGKISAELADITIITDDNPRTESAENIRSEIASANPKALNIEGREEAIKKGLEILKEGDSLLIAGKGHEDYQIIGTQKNHFSDQEVIKANIPLVSLRA